MSLLNVNLKKYLRQIQHPVIDLKKEILVKIINNFILWTIYPKRSILDVSQDMSLPLTSINQTLL